MQQVQFENMSLSVYPTNDNRQWYMTVEQVAEAYGRSRTVVMDHLRNHDDEIRRGIEADVGIFDIRSENGIVQKREQTILYREGVIKLGFFIRSPKAAAFRQFATSLIIQYMDDIGHNNTKGFQRLMGSIDFLVANQQETNRKLDSLLGISETVFGNDFPEIKRLIEEAAKKFNMTETQYWGRVRQCCDVSSYKLQNRRIMEFIRSDLGYGIKGVLPAQGSSSTTSTC